MRRDEFHAPDKKNFLMKTIIFVEIHLRPPAKATRSLRSGPYAQSHRDESNAASPTRQAQRGKSPQRAAVLFVSLNSLGFVSGYRFSDSEKTRRSNAPVGGWGLDWCKRHY